MSLVKLPSYTTLTDGQFVTVEGPNAITTGYSYDSQQRALYFKESEVIYPSFHGSTHIAEDPVPSATCDTPGLMAADDKCKLDALLQTRVGILGFQGAGFPDDGGWMQGDIILAAGTEFISLERIGNVVRFTVDSPIPLNCACEECTQIFWVQDETDVASIRPPTCAGKLPGANVYGELKVYAFPESTIVDPNNVKASLNNKGNYPALIFKRYDDALTPGSAELEVILKRDNINKAVTEIGWAFTPGATGMVECVWFTGKDKDGNQTRFDLEPEAESSSLGALLYKGHLITKKMGVIVNYSSTILSTNQYLIKEWDIDRGRAIGDEITARNVWQYINPENSTSGPNPSSLVLDSTIDVLPIGTLVDIWWFKVGEVSGEPIRRYYFSKKPSLNPNNLWSLVGQAQFGDTETARKELLADSGSEDKVSCETVSIIRDFEKAEWGLTGYDDPVYIYDIAATAGAPTEGEMTADVSYEHRAVIDTELPGLRVNLSSGVASNFSERPVMLWNRTKMCNAYLRMDIGRPSFPLFTPYDIILRAPIDEYTEKYMRVTAKGVFEDGTPYIQVCGVGFSDLPKFGTVRSIYPRQAGVDVSNKIFNYKSKLVFGASCNEIYLMSADGVEYAGNVDDVVELAHQEYNSPVVRLAFNYNYITEVVELQFKVGILDMCKAYEENVTDDYDDYLRGLADGYAVSAVYSQAGTFTGAGNKPDASPEGFVVYEGGYDGTIEANEYWNRLEIMLRDNQVWIWWNQLLIPPSTSLTANLPVPPTNPITTPYFPIEYDTKRAFGKVGARLWPGASVRRIDVRTQLSQFSEFNYGQLEINAGS